MVTPGCEGLGHGVFILGVHAPPTTIADSLSRKKVGEGKDPVGKETDSANLLIKTLYAQTDLLANLPPLAVEKLMGYRSGKMSSTFCGSFPHIGFLWQFPKADNLVGEAY